MVVSRYFSFIGGYRDYYCAMKPTKPPDSAGRPPSRSRPTFARQKVKESDGLMQHRDNSIAAATRQKEQADNKLQKSKQHMDKLSLSFNNEVKKLKACQDKLCALQKNMAFNVSNIGDIQVNTQLMF
jgi:hypothetical protein